jgi:hypothetical protein
MFGFDLSPFLLFVALVGVPFLSSIIGYRLARSRNREKWLWAFLCFLFPLLIVVLLCLGDRNVSQNNNRKDGV